MTESSTVDAVSNESSDSSNGTTDDENLTGFQYMKKYYENTSPYRRQQIAKNIIQIFGAEMGNKANEDEIFVVYDAFVNDKDTAVRTDIMEQSGKLASFLYAMTLSEQLSYYSDYISVHILSSIYKLILDPASQVRKASRLALIMLIENKILSEDQIIKEVLPLVENVLDNQNIDDLRAEAVTLLVRLACICGQKTTLEHFIHKFVSLCRDPIFSVRKTCALSLPDFINVVGPEATESLLLPELPHLVNDSVWGVRKICAESFTVFSENVSSRTRREVLSPLYLTCFNDDSRWVKIAAFQGLGKFIATFADVLSSGVTLAQGDLDNDCPEVILHPEILAKMRRANENTSLQLRWASNVFWNVPPPQVFDLDLEEPETEQSIPIFSGDNKTSAPSEDIQNSNNDSAVGSKNNSSPFSDATSTSESIAKDSGYSSIPFGDAGKTKTAVENGSVLSGADEHKSSCGGDDDLESIYSTRVAVARSSVGDDAAVDELVDDPKQDAGGLNSAAVERIDNQRVVPSDLLFQYVSMCDPKTYQTIDPELARHCAYSIPAVTFTLGRENWPCLRAAYSVLAKDMSWKVRRSLAFSIHVMALMLGPEIMMNDLVPIFDGFLNDLDDVKAGILRHFSEFLRLLPPGQPRESYLGRLAGFIKPDNVRNWRFREDLAHQLTQLCELYSSESVKRYIVPLTVSLCSDRVAQVRQCSFLLVATIIAKFHNERAAEIANYFRGLLLDRFAKCTMFFGRLTYVQMCEVAMSQPNIDVEMFSQDYLPSLLALHTDNVVNIRIALSRTLNCLYEIRPEFVKYKTFNSDFSIDDVVQLLSLDVDRDVKHFCMKNAVLFGSTTPLLNNSEVFEADDANATFVVSQSTSIESTTSEDSVISYTNVESEDDPSGSNIGRHLQSVLDELDDKDQSEIGAAGDEASDSDNFSPTSPNCSPTLSPLSSPSSTEVIGAQSFVLENGDGDKISTLQQQQLSPSNKSFDDEVFEVESASFSDKESSISDSPIVDSVCLEEAAATSEYDKLASQITKCTLEESTVVAAAKESSSTTLIIQEQSPSELESTAQIQSSPSSSNC